MRKLLIFILFLLFILNRETVLLSGIEAINIWTNTIFPLLFPTFILSDLLISSGIVNTITKIFGKIYTKLFKLPAYGMYIFLISLISGTPTNAKNLKILRDANYISDLEVTKILSTCVFFNPLLIISVTNLKVLLILWLSNIITGIIMNRKNTTKYIPIKNVDKPFNLGKSIENNVNLLLNILGTITVFLMLSSIITVKIPLIKVLIAGLLEVTNGLNKLNLFFKSSMLFEYLALLILSFGGLSIFIQIKSILKDTSIDIKYFLCSRLLCANISLGIIYICSIT